MSILGLKFKNDSWPAWANIKMGSCAYASRKSEIKPVRNSPVTIENTKLVLARRYNKKVEQIETMKLIFKIKDMNAPILSLQENKLYNQRISSTKSQVN